MKRIAFTQYDGATIQQQYTKSLMEKYPLARPLNLKGKGGAAAAFAIAIPDPTGGIIAGSLLLVALTASAAEAEVAKQRTERLNANGLHTTVAGDIYKTVQGRLAKLGYAVAPVPAIKYETFDASKPVRLGKALPTLGTSESRKQIQTYAKQGELLLILNTLTMGIEQRDRFGKKSSFHPFVVIGVRGYETATGKVATKYELVAVAPNPLPVDKDLDSAIADKAVLKKAYDEAIQLAIEEIVGDFDKSDATIQLAKPDAKTKPAPAAAVKTTPAATAKPVVPVKPAPVTNAKTTPDTRSNTGAKAGTNAK